jgi:hypothetical protein
MKFLLVAIIATSCTFTSQSPFCTVTRSGNISTISCPDGTRAQLSDGVDGNDGADGVDGEDGDDAVVNGSTILAVIDPCGDTAGIHDEVLLRLSNNTLISSFSDAASGLNTRFSLLRPGSYITTDGSVCRFTIDANLNLTNEHF